VLFRSLKEQGELADELKKLAAKICEDIADDAVDADGNLAPEHAKTKLGKKYIELQKKAAGAVTATEQEAQVFNHLWNFFSRYYDDGDFLSTRRYSSREKYVIPYNGEEVHLHWANRDQYYIKTGENFTDYQWKAGDVTVLFKLVQAETEKDNVKAGEKRFYLPRLEDVSNSKKTVTIPFEYRALTKQESITFQKNNQQEAILAAAIESLPRRKTLKSAPEILSAMMAEHRKTTDGKSVSRFEHHLRRYTAKNTRDYFIHKDLGGFLSRELDFYLKNEVLALDDLEAGDAKRAEGWFELLQAIRSVGSKIIAFVTQIENFQKRIFEKRKFVTEANYCFTLDRVPKSLWPAILKNKAQVDEWKKLYAIEDLKGYSTPLKKSFLEVWPSLMIDTVFFANESGFMDVLLSAQDDIDDSIDGLLVNSENFQGLNNISKRFQGNINCVYTDPPYNTGDSEILYKNEYLKSSWLTLMENRLSLTTHMLPLDSVMFIAIDDFELVDLSKLIDTRFSQFNRTMIVVNHHPQGGKAEALANTHEYMLAIMPKGNEIRLAGRSTGDVVEERPFKRSGTAQSNFRKWRQKSFYAILVNPNNNKVVGLEPPPKLGESYPTQKTTKGLIRVSGGPGKRSQ
jgi:adenine-specific DNA-methyltransferase